MKRTSNVIILCAFAVSLALHLTLARPFVMPAVETPPIDEMPTLVIELQGVESDEQVEERVAQPQAAEQPRQQEPSQQPAPPPSPQDEAGDKPPDPQPQISAEPQPSTVTQTSKEEPDDQQEARTLKIARDLEANRLREYVKGLTRKIQANLVYPNEGRRAGLHGNATVSFRLSTDGQIKPGSLAIVASSGQPQLDASALATVRNCAPFAPPPREIALTLVVGYGRK